jgi:hypothetical protein
VILQFPAFLETPNLFEPCSLIHDLGPLGYSDLDTLLITICTNMSIEKKNDDPEATYGDIEEE